MSVLCNNVTIIMRVIIIVTNVKIHWFVNLTHKYKLCFLFISPWDVKAFFKFSRKFSRRWNIKIKRHNSAKWKMKVCLKDVFYLENVKVYEVAWPLLDRKSRHFFLNSRESLELNKGETFLHPSIAILFPYLIFVFSI